MPDSSSSCGELIDPALTTTSPAARASRIFAAHRIANADAALAFEQQRFGQRPVSICRFWRLRIGSR